MREWSDGGWTLVELLVTMVMGLVILGALLSVWPVAASDQQRSEARYESIDGARIALERMTRDVRESVAVTGVTASAVHLKLWTRDLPGAGASVLHDVVYDCAAAGSLAGTFACNRSDVTAGTPAVTMVNRLSSSAVFTSTAGQPDLSVNLSVIVAKAVNPVVIRGGASPRNCTGALSACTGS
jgi:Tfp pilus assembly protein PilW